MPGRTRILLFIAALCSVLSWHPAPASADIIGRPHDLRLSNPKGHCLNCHDPHQPNLGAGYAHTLKRPNEISVCYQCHAGTPKNYTSIDPSLTNVTALQSFYNISQEFNQANIHFPKYGMDGEVNKCSECHNPHGVFNSNSTIRKPKLLSAGQDAVTDTDEYCLVCHNSDSNPPHRPFSNITVRNQFKFSRTVYKQMEHSTFYRWSTANEPSPDTARTYDDNPYGKGKDISCLTCHRPHGSSNPYMLTASNDQNFCLKCHKGGIVFGISVPSLNSFTSSGHGRRNLGSYKTVCQDCHFPHGTGQRHAIYTSLKDPHTGNSNLVKIGSQGMNAACYACHASRSSSGYYTGPAYNSSIHKTSANSINPGNTNGQAAGDCDNCHDPHGVFGNYSKMTVARKENLCYVCHSHTTPNSASGRNIYDEFQKSSRHDLSKVACKNCHNVHTVTASSSMMNPFHPASTVSDNKTFCLKCHSGTMPAGMTGAFNVVTGVFKRWTNNGHDRLHVLACSDCHSSHGSPNIMTLNYKTIIYNGYSASFGTRTGLSFNKRKFCEVCHNHRGTTGYKGASTIQAGPNYAAAHSPGDTTPCSSCHKYEHNPLLTSYTGTSAYYNGYCLNCHTQGTGNAYQNVESEFNYPNRAINGGMESSLTGWTANAGTTATSDTTTFHGGAASVKLVTGSSGDHFLYQTNIAVLPSKSYAYSGWVYVPAALTGGSTVDGVNGPYTALRVIEYKSNGSFVADHENIATARQSTSGWVNVSDTWTTNANTGQVQLRVELQGTGTAWWDDLSLAPAGVTPQSGSTHAITYSPPTTNDCSVCHGTHSNLTAAADVVDPNPAYLPGQSLNSTAYNAFCLKCHGTSPVNIGSQAPMNIIDTYTSAGHGMASLSTKVLCSQCHEHHGGVNKKLIKQTINNSAVSSSYSGINISACTACHKATDRNLALWPGYSVYSGSVHAFGNTSTGNLVKDGTHGPGVCDNCHNPHGVRVSGQTMPYMAYKKAENLCYRCHASGFDNFSSAGDYNDRWDHFGTVLGTAKQSDSAQSSRNKMALHVGQSGGQSIAQNVAVWDGLVSSNAFPDSDSVITVQLKVPNYTFKNGQLTAGLRLEDAKSSSNTAPSSSNYIGVFYNMTTSAASAWRSNFSSGQYSGVRTLSPGSATSYTTLKITRKKAFGTFSSYAGTQPVIGGRFTTSGFFKVRLYAYVSGNKNALPEALEAWFDSFNVQYTGSGTANLAHNTASGDDVQARFQMKTHHKITDAEQTDGSRVECTDCHDPHTITEKNMGYQNTSSVSGKSVQAIAADQNFCLKCHRASPPQGIVFPAGGNTVWDKSLFDSSAHGNPLKRYKTLQPGQTFLNYSNGVYYACKVCHNTHGTNQAHMQRDSWDINRDGIPDDIDGDGILDSTSQVGFIGYTTHWNGTAWVPVKPRYAILVKQMAGIPSRAAFQRISSTIPPQANGAIDVELCLICHDGKPAPDVRSDFVKPSHHPVEFAQQTAMGGAKIECYSCHDQHRAQARNDAAGEYATTNPTGQREPMPGDAAFCLKCHDTDNGNPPPGVDNVSFGNRKLKNIKLSYNPNNYVDSKGYDLITSSKQGHFVQSTGKAMICRDCHNQHGSDYGHMLRDNTEPLKPGYDSTQPIQNMRPVALWPSDPYSGSDSAPLTSTAERCLSCHSGRTTYKGNLIPLPPPPTAAYTGFTSLPEVGKHPDVKSGMSVGNGLAMMNGHLYSGTFAISTSTGSVKDSCTTCHDSHKPYIQTVGDELTDCYNCHNANTSLPDVQTEFDANPLNRTRSKSYHPIKYDPTQPSGVECMKCHDQAKHMQGRVRLRKDPSHSIDPNTNTFINLTSDAQVWVSQATSVGYVNDGTQPFTNNSTMVRFCTECHDRYSTRRSDFNGNNAPTMSFNTMSGAHFTNGSLVCTNCHEYHGSVNTMMKKNSFATNYEPTPAAQTQSLEGTAFCYGCHVNKANSSHGIDIQFKFMSTLSHHQVGASEQAANGKPSSGSKLACKNCHNVHLVTRAMPVTYGNLTTTLANVDASFCISCHNGTGARDVKFPGYTTGGSGAEWDPVTGAWNKWNKESYTSSLHTTRGNMTCGKCHDSHGSSNYRLLLANVTAASGYSGSARNIAVRFGVHSTLRGKRTEEIGVNGVCGACHKNTMGNYTGYTVYPGYASYTALTFGRKSGIDKNCTYCHNPHGTSQTRFGNDTSAVARMMRANKPLYMNMTSKNYGSAYNFKKTRGFGNSTTGAPYYAFCSSRGCHASEKTAGNTFVTAAERAKPLYDTFSMNTTVDRFSKYPTSSSHHPIKEGILTCNSCHKEHGTSTKTTDYLKPDLKAPYFQGSNWPLLWHGGTGRYPYTPTGWDYGPHGYDGNNSCYSYSCNGNLNWNGTDYFEMAWNGLNATPAHRNQVTTVTPPGNANDLCFMCHYKTDIVGIDGYRNMSSTNTRFLGHEAVAGGAKMSHLISYKTPIPANGEYHNFSCSACHFPHATTQNRLVKTSCMASADNQKIPAPGDGDQGRYIESGYNPYGATLWGCHAYTKFYRGATAYPGWRNLTTSAKTDFQRPHNTVTDLSATIDATQTDQNMNVNLAWTAVKDDQTGLGANHYDIYRYTQYIKQETMPYATRISQGANGSGAAAGQQMTFTDKTGQPNITYYYVVVACDAQKNESLISNCISVHLGPDTVPPNAISNQQLSQPAGTTNVYITWQDPRDNINVTSYKVYRQAGVSSITDVSLATYLTPTVNEPPNGLSADGTSDVDTYTFTDNTLTATNIGTQYAYAVVAFDAAGNPATNAVINSHLPTGASSNLTLVDPAPAIVSMTAVPVSRNMQATLSWSAPSNVGTIDHYNVYRDTQLSMATKTLVTPSGTSSSPYTDTVPLTGTNYYYMVTAVDQSSGKESAPGNVYGPINIPAAPTGLSSSMGNNSQATLTWTAPVYTTGLSSYNVYKRLNGGSWSLATNVATTSATLSFTGLQPGTYDFYVSAVYSTYEGVFAYESLSSNTSTLVVIDTSAPSSFTLTGALSGDHTHATINWNAPADNNYAGYTASGVDHYVIASSYNSGSTWTTLTSNYQPPGYATPGSAQSYADPATQPVGGTVMYNVQAVDVKGNYSPTAAVTINLGPASVTDLGVTSLTSTTGNLLRWSPTSGYLPLASYNVYAKEQGTALASLTGATLIGTVTSHYTTNPGNLALASAGGTPSSTTTRSPSWPVTTVNDNNTGSYWEGNYTGPDNLVISWGTAVTIARVTFNFYTISNYVPKNFLIQTWNGSSWDTQVTVTGNASTSPATYYFPAPVSTTKVQLYITDTVGGIGFYFPIVAEFYVYGGEQFTHSPSNAYLPAQVGHTYAYAAIAYDTGGLNSPISTGATTVKTVVDADVPSKVTDLALSNVAGTGKVHLAWTAPTDNVAATQYTVYRYTSAITDANYGSATVVYTKTAPYGTPSYDDTGLADGSGTYYAVRSGDAAGNWSLVSNSPYINNRPSTVTLSVTNSTTATANILSFGPSTSLAGLASYLIYAVQQSTALTSGQLVPQNQIGTITTNLTSAQSFTHGNLSGQVGKPYAYAVVAVDVNGLSSAMSNSPVFTVVDKDPPSKITDLNLTSPVGTTQVNITWSTPLDNVAVTQYQVYRMPTSIVNTPTEVTDTSATLLYTGTYASNVAGTPNSYTDNTWYDGYKAYYAVRSRDLAGNWSPMSSSQSSPCIIVGQDSTPPISPTITGITVGPSPELDVNWTASSDPDDLVSGYALYRADSTTPPFNTDGCITANNIGSATKVSDTIPYYYTQWADVGGLSGHTYYYALRAYDTASPKNWSSVCSGCCSSATVATTAIVTSPPTWTSQTPLTVTGDPTVQYPDIDLIWTAASDNGQGQAGALDHYNIYRGKTAAFASMSSIATVSGLNTSYIDRRGIAGTTYYYGIVAVDASTSQLASTLSNVASATVGPESCSDSGKNYPTVNNMPTVPTIAASTGTYPLINLNWTGSTDVDDCGNTQPLNYYRLYYAASSTTIPNDAHDKSKYPTEESLNIIGVYTLILDNQQTTYPFRGTGGTSYNFRLEAYDMAGNYSGPSSQVTGQVASAPCSTSTPPTVPASFTATVGPAPDMDLTWSASTVGGCSGSNLIDHYNLYRKQCSSFDAQGNPVPSITASTVLSSITPIRISGNSTGCIDTTGLPSTPYSYVLTAVDSQGNESGKSSIITKTTEADTTIPAAINDLKATQITGGGIQITWCKTSDNVGVTHYDIYRVAQATIVQDNQIVPDNLIFSSSNTGKCVTYKDTAVTSGTTYSYAVIAVDGAGNRSTISAGAHSGDTYCAAP